MACTRVDYSNQGLGVSLTYRTAFSNSGIWTNNTVIVLLTPNDM